jgi:hypothetical protein
LRRAPPACSATMRTFDMAISDVRFSPRAQGREAARTRRAFL